ncbi:MAG: hypothetical protein ABIH18_06645 [Candidatus Omnitrophota bacterium]
MTFEELVIKISPVLKKITYKLKGYSYFLNEEDLFQESSIFLWENYKQGKLSDKTDSYILQGCYFYLKNYLRKARDKACLMSMEYLIEQEGVELRGLAFCEGQKPDFWGLDSDMISKRIGRFGLTLRETEVLNLSMERVTIRDIGKQLGISHVMVLKIKNKIKEKCRGIDEEIRMGYQK